jgi:hypothetical protein
MNNEKTDRLPDLVMLLQDAPTGRLVGEIMPAGSTWEVMRSSDFSWMLKHHKYPLGVIVLKSLCRSIYYAPIGEASVNQTKKGTMNTEKLPDRVRLNEGHNDGGEYISPNFEWKVVAQENHHWVVAQDGPSSTRWLPKALCNAIYDAPKDDKRWIPIAHAETYTQFWAWHPVADRSNYFYSASGEKIKGLGYTHWMPAHPPEGPAEESQEDKDNDTAMEYFKKKYSAAEVNELFNSGKLTHLMQDFLAGLKYAREAEKPLPNKFSDCSGDVFFPPRT